MSSPTDRNSAVALITERSSDLEWLGNILSRATRRPVVQLGGLEALGGALPCELVAIDFGKEPTSHLPALLDEVAKSAQPSLLLVFLTDGAEQQEELAALLSTRALTNLVATKRREFVENDIITTVQKILRRDIFGIDKYFAWGVEIMELVLNTSSAKRGALEEIQRYTESIGIPGRLGALFRVVADEFITNALYNGPVDDEGRNRFASLPRTQEITLDTGEEIRVSCCCDGRRLGISIVDPFGSLTPPVVLNTMARCFEESGQPRLEENGGAGIGLYRCLDSLSHLVINMSSGKKTECIGLIDVRGSYRHFAEGGKSFNIFVEDQKP